MFDICSLLRFLHLLHLFPGSVHFFPRWICHVIQLVHWWYCYGVVQLMPAHWSSINHIPWVNSAKVDFLHILVIFQINVIIVKLDHIQIHCIKINKNKRERIYNTLEDHNTYMEYFKIFATKRCESIQFMIVDLYFLLNYSFCTTLVYLHIITASNDTFYSEYQKTILNG